MNAVLLSLKQQLCEIEKLIVDKQDVLYFDYPLHLNVGDLLIYAGTEKFFQDYQINIRLRRCLQAFDLDEVKNYVGEKTTILCHGGGNFGDLYPEIQKMREDLVQHFPHNRIILLPQTAYFSDQQSQQKSAALFAQHPDCHLFARDSRTYELMQQFSANVYLSPDMAHQLYGSLPQKDRAHLSEMNVQNTLYFLRKDIESSHVEKAIQSQLPATAKVQDWDDILQPQDMRIELWLSRLSKIANTLKWAWLKNRINDLWYRYALRVIARCQQAFLANDFVVTSRLHGHIFSCLLGIPNQVCDNSYGKNTSYYFQWTQNIDYTSLYEEK